MLMTSNAVQDRVVPYWNEIKKWDKNEKFRANSFDFQFVSVGRNTRCL